CTIHLSAHSLAQSNTHVSRSSSLPPFFNPPPPTATYTLSLHDALPISASRSPRSSATRSSRNVSGAPAARRCLSASRRRSNRTGDRKSTRLNSSHQIISYAVFCLKKKNATSRAQRIDLTQSLSCPQLRD